MIDIRKINGYDVHCHSSKVLPVQREYGLQIIGGVCGGVSSPGSFDNCAPRYFDFFALSHMYDGQGRLWLPEHGECFTVEAGDCIIMPAGQINRYGGGAHSRYVEDTIWFAGPVADMLLKSSVIACGIVRLGHSRRLPQIIDLAQDLSSEGQIAANIELQRLLFEMYSIRRLAHKPGVIDVLLNILRDNSSRWYQVSELAQMCNIGEDLLRRLFLERTGMRPKEYMEHLKMNLAADRLLAGDEPVREIAESLGYLDPFHFSRRFKQCKGISPAAYRSSYRSLGMPARTMSANV